MRPVLCWWCDFNVKNKQVYFLAKIGRNMLMFFPDLTLQRELLEVCGRLA